MQHIHINDATSCTFVNVASESSKVMPHGANARACSQCEKVTWRLTPLCMHCGHDRFRRARWIAGSSAAFGLTALVIFHPLIRG